MWKLQVIAVCIFILFVFYSFTDGREMWIKRINRWRRGRALDFFRQQSWDKLRNKLQALRIIDSEVTFFELGHCLKIAGFFATARAYGDYLYQTSKRLQADKTDVDMQLQMEQVAVQNVAKQFAGHEFKTWLFLRIALAPYRNYWILLCPGHSLSQYITQTCNKTKKVERGFQAARRQLIRKAKAEEMLAYRKARQQERQAERQARQDQILAQRELKANQILDIKD